LKAAQLVPWVPPFITDYLVVLADPRRQSADLRLAVQYLESSSSTPTAPHTVIAIIADSIQENKKVATWIKETTAVRVFADSSSLDWMKTYSCIDDTDRWSLHILIFDSDGVIRSHADKVDPSHASQLVSEMIEGAIGNNHDGDAA